MTPCQKCDGAGVIVDKFGAVKCEWCGGEGERYEMNHALGSRPAPSPSELWRQADAEHPDNAPARAARYRELMIEHGHLILVDPEGPDDA